MAKQGYGLRHYSSGSSSSGAAQTLAAALSSLHDDVLNRYLPTSVPSVDLSTSSTTGLGTGDDPDFYSYPYKTSWSSSSPVLDSLFPSSSKRSSRVLYPQTMYGAPTSLGQTEAWYSTNAISKRPRFASVSDISIYPQRPGEKDCAHYMLTRTCKFGDSCKYDHPVWVPDGGIPDWKEVPIISATDTLPERPGQPDCPYYLKTQTCKYGSNCKFNHPKDTSTDSTLLLSAFPERPSEPLCTFYMKTGKCKFGAICKFNHPKDIQITSSDLMDSKDEQSIVNLDGIKASELSIAPLSHNSKGLPLRLGEVDCTFYMKTGSCKFGSACRYNHPDRNGANPPTAGIDFSALATLAANYSSRSMDPVSSLYNPRPLDPVSSLYNSVIGRSSTGTVPSSYPQRPGQIECDYYMKTGECKFAERCKFHHPLDRFVPFAKETQRATVKLTLAGLPRREDVARCPFYMKTGACKYGANCKFDHPPPGEVIGEAASHAANGEADANV